MLMATYRARNELVRILAEVHGTKRKHHCIDAGQPKYTGAQMLLMAPSWELPIEKTCIASWSVKSASLRLNLAAKSILCWNVGQKMLIRVWTGIVTGSSASNGGAWEQLEQMLCNSAKTKLEILMTIHCHSGPFVLRDKIGNPLHVDWKGHEHMQKQLQTSNPRFEGARESVHRCACSRQGARGNVVSSGTSLGFCLWP